MLCASNNLLRGGPALRLTIPTCVNGVYIEMMISDGVGDEDADPIGIVATFEDRLRKSLEGLAFLVEKRAR